MWGMSFFSVGIFSLGLFNLALYIGMGLFIKSFYKGKGVFVDAPKKVSVIDMLIKLTSSGECKVCECIVCECKGKDFSRKGCHEKGDKFHE